MKKTDSNEKRGGIYIHIPFCVRKCAYCDFLSAPADEKTQAEYVKALQTEIYQTAKLLSENPYTVDTVFFGGGTPSILAPGHVKALADTLRESFPFAENAEITIECNPGTLDEEKAAVYRQAGINRISFGLQSANNRELKMLGRIHTMEEFVKSYETARAAGFDNINMDLIMGLPEEDLDDVRHTLEEIEALRPDSLTVHSLAIKRAARLNMFKEEYSGLKINNTPEMIAMSEACARRLGMEPYYLYRQKNMAGNFENVGYSLPGKACIYNILIMEELQTIAACGAGTTTKVVFPAENRRERCENVKEVEQYISRIDEMIGRKERILG